jgi:hypothetical protein
MKTATFMFAAMLAVISGISMARTTNPSQTVDTKTESIRVSGNCDMCKSRIETAVQIKGVNKEGIKCTIACRLAASADNRMKRI